MCMQGNKVTAKGFEPPSSEPESDVLSVELRSRKGLQNYRFYTEL